MKTRISQLHIINVYERAEGFLESFRDEHPQSNSWKYNEKDDLLKSTLKNIGDDYAKNKQIIGSLEIDLFDYYRKIRNRFVHPEIDESKNDNRVPNLRTEVFQVPNYNSLDAPNIYKEVKFDDFTLFTRAIKHIAKFLCIKGRPNDQEISEMTIKNIKLGKVSLKLQTLSRLKNNPKRALNALESFLRELYCLDKEEAEPIVQLLYCDLLA